MRSLTGSGRGWMLIAMALTLVVNSKDAEPTLALGLMAAPLASATSGPAIDVAEGVGDVTVANVAKSVRYGKNIVLKGSLEPKRGGVAIVLERDLGDGWKRVMERKTSKQGRYSFKVAMKRTGLVRIRAKLQSGGEVRKIAVRSKLDLRRSKMNIWSGQSFHVRGRLLHALPGRRVVLELRKRGRWAKAQSRLTGGQGTFHFKVEARIQGTVKARVRFAGDEANLGTRQTISLSVFKTAFASYYGGGGTTACGQSLTDSMVGVAHKTLPCGTIVKFLYGGRVVEAPVIDRGPFIAGRDFDLTVGLKRRLGFGDLGSLGYSIGR